ncbi:glycerol acyltransferase [Bacteroidia bacterium]|nr:glycerol acyltransferase [Bacteroidia bacterium]
MLVNVEQILASKSPRLARRLPAFVLRYLEHVIHQNDVNYILQNYGHLQGLEFVRAALQHLNITYTVHGEQNLQQAPHALFLSNHPLGGFDGVVLLDVLGKIYPNIQTVINDLLMNIVPLRPLFLPINKHGVQPQEYARQLQTAYASDKPILYFPAGLCSRKIKGVVQDLPWRPGTAKIVRDYQRDVVPVFFSGRNSNFFYNLANLRKMLKIKANIEMLYLVDELFRQRNAHYDVYFGTPIPHSTLTQMGNLNKMITFVRERSYQLAQNSKSS